jgi:hypothetical protein
MAIDESLHYSLLFKEEAAKVMAIMCQNSLICKTEAFLSHGKVGRNIGVAKRCDGNNPAWRVITPINLETKEPLPEQGQCRKTSETVVVQLAIFGAMAYCLVWAEPKTHASSDSLYLQKNRMSSYKNSHVFTPIESHCKELSNSILVDIWVKFLAQTIHFPARTLVLLPAMVFGHPHQ